MNALSPAPLNHLRVLLVEDDATDIELIVARLATLHRNPEVVSVDCETDFRARLRDAHFDVILADILLPKFSGADALAIAQEEVPETPFIFVSGLGGEEHAVEMLKQGATDYLLKQRLQRLPMMVHRAIGEAAERRKRIRAEEALREYETGFRLLVDALKDYAVIGLDRNGNVRSWNSAAERLLGWSADQIIGDSVSRLYGIDANGEADARQALLASTAAGSHVRERWLAQNKGPTFFASIVTTAIRGDGGELIGFSKIIRDVTEAHQAADALRLAKEQAEAANAAKDRFLAMLSHELRTPLTPILAATNFIEQRVKLPDGLADLMPMIRRNVELEARLIDDLLDLNTISHGKLSLSLKPMDLHDALRDLLNTTAVEAADKGIRLTTRLDAAEHLVHGDAARVQQIAGNLLRNALKFTAAGGSVVVDTFNPEPGSIVFRVIDDGIGIGEAAMPRIFSAFEQADRSITRQFGGLGLGLAIARALAVKHGGELVAASDGPDQGASFSLRLPLTLAARPEAAAAPAVRTAAEPASPLHILLVEDNQDTTLAMVTLLGLSGHTVAAAASVEEARELVGDGAHYDLLISDLGLPDGDGIDVVRAFSASQHAPSIALTGYGMDEDVRRCRDAGFSAHVTKPVGFDRLNELIQTLTKAAA